MDYINVDSQSTLPDISALAPFKAVIIIEAEVSPARRAAVSEWLVSSGCAYIMAWGVDCAAWEASVGPSVRQDINDIEVPSERIVITTTHDGELLNSVFWFAKHTAMHPCFKLDNVVLLHLAPARRESELCAQYSAA